MPTIHAIFLLTVRRIQKFISLKPSPSQVETSLKISARWVRRFGGVREQTNRQTDSLTDWRFYRVTIETSVQALSNKENKY